jgi:hypothetical protein
MHGVSMKKMNRGKLSGKWREYTAAKFSSQSQNTEIHLVL